MAGMATAPRTRAFADAYERAFEVFISDAPPLRRIVTMLGEIEHLDERGLPAEIQLAHRELLARAAELRYVPGGPFRDERNLSNEIMDVAYGFIVAEGAVSRHVRAADGCPET